MSRWSSSPVAVRVSTGSVFCVSPDGTVGAEVALLQPLHAPGAGAAVLGPALREAIGEADAGRGLAFELAAGLCRFEVVPWIEGVHSRAERLTLARARFETVYGSVAREWAVDLCDAGYGRGGLAVAVPADLPLSIVRACLDIGAAATSVRPACSDGIDRLLRRAGTRRAWLVVPERDQSFVGAVDRGGWTAATCLHEGGRSFLRPLGDVLLRETLLADGVATGMPVLIDASPKPGERRTSGDQPARPPLGALEAGGQRWALEWVGL